jgi:general L-amino acid transport system permease protein
MPERARALAKGLFGTPANAALTLALLALAWWIVPPFLRWAVLAATWVGDSRAACAADGACWAFVAARGKLFLVGRYPWDQVWRPGLAVALLLGLSAGALSGGRHAGKFLVLLVLGLPPVAGVLLAGGVSGLRPVPTGDWGGLLLNVTLCFLAVILALPLGVALAFGRQSAAPVTRALSIAFIEFWRGVPLLAVLFMGLVMLPLFLPAGVTLDNLIRAQVVLTLFTSAYLAEVVRGGILGVPRGQAEAASALGLSDRQVKLGVILPQALRRCIGGVINIVVDLFKDTTLVSIVGLFDLMGVITQSLRDRDWLGLATEGYVFAAIVFFACCLVMSIAGSRVEKRLNAGVR